MDQWDFQDPKMEVPTIYKAYIRAIFQGISPQNMALYGTVPPCLDPGIPIEWMNLGGLFDHPLSGLVPKKSLWYPLVICYIAIENDPFSSLIYLLKMVIFHNYLSLPEGNEEFDPENQAFSVVSRIVQAR